MFRLFKTLQRRHQQGLPRPRRAGWARALLLSAASAAFADDAVPDLSGTWSAPSLSRPGQMIEIELQADGTATEQLGDDRGHGTWRQENARARIDWDSGWVGELEADAAGGHRLLTWRPGSDPDGAPDDRQPAVRHGRTPAR
ncbi:MAG: hypothetical protein EA400_16450 [Chromatiaceae bacterium]|nr:MAG: hypothetical protein EA400_16450 [Chromatiaceae bacterium]